MPLFCAKKVKNKAVGAISFARVSIFKVNISSSESQNMKVAVVGASGYAGAELCRIIARHPKLSLGGTFVSPNSVDLGKKMSDLYGSLNGICDSVLEPVSDSLSSRADVFFLATDHRVSHDLAPKLINDGKTVLDLSGAFRLSDLKVFEKAYGFAHEHADLLKDSIYALPEFTSLEELRSKNMISLPGCYPTASQLALKPLINAKLLDAAYRPVIDAVSGVSGAGRKAKLSSSFCEVSLSAYGVFTHRHQPEIAEHLGCEVIFTPHLGPFKRGILATVTAKLKSGISEVEVDKVYQDAYAHKPLVRFKHILPQLADVQMTPFCDLGFKVSDDGYIVVISAIDNLLKGAAAQAVQVLNLHCGFDETAGLV